MQDKFPFKVTGSKIAYQNSWIMVREDATRRPNGAEGIYGVLEVGDSVTVIAVDNAGKICLVESYRHPVRRWVWELPGGGADGEDALVAAARELQEETGITALEWHVLGRGRVCNGLSTEHQTNVLALGLTLNSDHEFEDEIRTLKFVELNEIDAMIARGEFEDGQSMAALYVYKNWLQAHQ